MIASKGGDYGLDGRDAENPGGVAKLHRKFILKSRALASAPISHFSTELRKLL